MTVAKVFWSGRSQAVRLPKEFRFDTNQVRIRRHGNALILEPMIDDWDWLTDLQKNWTFDQSLIDATEQTTPGQHQPDIDLLK